MHLKLIACLLDEDETQTLQRIYSEIEYLVRSAFKFNNTKIKLVTIIYLIDAFGAFFVPSIDILYSLFMDTSKKKFENSAIGSWSGYIYQGCCALYHVLTLLKRDRKKYEGYYLYVDSFEDFSIHDENYHIVSLHQVKCYNDKPDLNKILQQMLDTKQYHINKRDADNDTTLYIHYNKNWEIPNAFSSIKLYEYDGVTDCESNEILHYIRLMVEDLNANSIAQSIVCQLVKFVDEHVMDMAGDFHNNPSEKCQWQRAREKKYAIPFAKIADIVFANGVDNVWDKSSFFYMLRIQYINYCITYLHLMEEEPDDFKGQSVERIKLCVDYLEQLDESQWADFFNRINPQVYMKPGLDAYTNSTNKITMDYFFKVVSSCEPVDEHFLWNNELYKLHAPTTITQSNSIHNLCKDLYKNRMNVNYLFEYDWFVGNNLKSVPNIKSALKRIQDVTDTPTRIYDIKPVGLLSLEDKINNRKPE